MRISFTIFSFLFGSLLFSSYGQPETIKPKEPEVQRKTGCSNPKFVAAELDAYHELLAARAEAEKVLYDSITSIELQKKNELGAINLRYLKALNACKTASCTEGAKADNDKWVNRSLIYYDDAIVRVEEQEYDKEKDAQDAYNESVDKAYKLYCRAYTASGQDGPVVYSGTICSLDKPFTVTGTHPLLVYEFKFVPTSDSAGTFHYSVHQGALTIAGEGTYTIEGRETDKPKIIAETHSDANALSLHGAGSGEAHIDLSDLGTKGCDGK